MLPNYFTWTKLYTSELCANLTYLMCLWGFYPWSKLFWNAWKYLEGYAHLKINVNHLLAWRQAINTGCRHTEFPHEEPTLSMAIWKQIEKQTDMDPSSKKTNVSSQTRNPGKPRGTKPSLHPANTHMFSSLFSIFPHTLLHFGTYWKRCIIGLWFYCGRSWLQRPTEELDTKTCGVNKASFLVILQQNLWF